MQAIVFSLFSTELDLLVARFAFASAIDQFLEGDLFALSPGMRKYRIRRYFVVVNNVLGQAELASAVALQRTHFSGGNWENWKPREGDHCRPWWDGIYWPACSPHISQVSHSDSETPPERSHANSSAFGSHVHRPRFISTSARRLRNGHDSRSLGNSN